MYEAVKPAGIALEGSVRWKKSHFVQSAHPGVS